MDQQVFLMPVGNHARYGNNEAQEFTIKKIGRKYFDVGRDGDNERHFIKFHLDEERRQVTEYSANWKLYLSKQEILDEEESEVLVEEIRKKLNGYGKVSLTVDQLHKIADIIRQRNRYFDWIIDSIL